jgi:hypothetical protein
LAEASDSKPECCGFKSHRDYVNHALFKIRTINAPHLDDDDFIETVMNRLLADYPQIVGYTYERVDSNYLNLLVWGEIEVVEGNP